MDGPRLASRHGGEPPRGAAGRRAERDGGPALADHVQEPAHQHGLADAGAARDHQHLGAAGAAQGLALACRIRDAERRLGARDGVVRAKVAPGGRTAREVAQPRRHRKLGPVQMAREEAGPAAALLGDELALRAQGIDHRREFGGRHVEQPARARAGLVARQAAISVLHRRRDHARDAGAQADRRRGVDVEAGCDPVGGREPEARQVEGEAVGVRRDDVDRVGPVGPVNPHQQRACDAALAEEGRDVAHRAVRGPGLGDDLGPARADAAHPRDLVGLALDHVEHPRPEGRDEALREGGSDPPDEAGGQEPPRSSTVAGAVTASVSAWNWAPCAR